MITELALFFSAVMGHPARGQVLTATAKRLKGD